MRVFIPDVISPEEAEALVSYHNTKHCPGSIDHLEVIAKIKKAVEQVIKPNWDLPTYTRIEKLDRGHDWHVDTASNGHMKWCDYGCSVLLTDSEDAGFLEYREDKKIYPKEHYCGLAIHSSDVEHRTEQQGGRITFLAFIAEQQIKE